jgi:flagellar biosynthesis/type III secretory pathway M-ring protein FliF/YscJ
MADEDRIKEFLKLQKQIKQDPKRIATVIKQWMAEDTKPKNRPKK